MTNRGESGKPGPKEEHSGEAEFQEEDEEEKEKEEICSPKCQG